MHQSRCPAARGSTLARRLWPALTAAALTLAALPAVTGVLPPAPAGVARADEVTASQDLLRTGWDRDEPGLAPSVITGGTFGQLFSATVDGQVYAQPIVAGPTVIVATENDTVYGLNAVTGKVSWSTSLGTPWPSASEGCTDLAPYVGVTSTPVYDSGTGTVYLVAESVPGGDSYHPVFNLVGLDATTGAITSTVPIGGPPVNDPTRPFDPFTQLQRPALMLLGGSVYAAFGSHCDYTPYAGYVAGVNLTTHAVTLWSDEAGVTDNMAGIWQSGGGLMSDGAGRIFLTSGNGVSPAPGKGTAPPPELAESVVRLGVQSDGTLAAQDFFSPANAPNLDAADTDFGSGAPVGLPVGSAAFPHLLVQAGKNGRVFLLNRGNLGGRKQAPQGGDAVVSKAGPFNGQWGHPAVFEASTSPLPANSTTLNDYVYYLGKNDNLRALRLTTNSSGQPVLKDVANSPTTFGYTSGSPVVTSNGTTASSAVVWVIGASGGSGANGTLYAFDAVPKIVSGALQLKQIWSAPIGTAAKFATPATDGNRVYVGTRDGHVLGFGSPSAAPLTGGSPLNFPGTAVSGTSGPQTVTVTATGPVTVSGVTASSTTSPDPFTLGQITETPSGGSPANASFPVSLQAGDALSVPVTFGPSAAGAATGSLSFATNSANFPTVDVSLSGTGTQDGLAAAPAALTYGSPDPVPAGISVPMTVDITNTGATDATITNVVQPTGPFTATGLTGLTTIPAGQSVVVSVSYAPTTAGTDNGSLEIDGSTGNVTVNLTGTGVAGQSQFTSDHATVDFGSVSRGQQASTVIDITNTGNLPAVVQSSSVPHEPFGTPEPVANSLPVNPGYDLKVPVTFTPAGLGTASATYTLTYTDVQGTHSLQVPLTGTGVAGPAGRRAINPPGGGWTLNGSARMTGTSLVLTPATKSKAGSAVYPVPVPSDGLTTTFTAQIGGGTGADGMTFSLLDPASSGPTSIGGTGGLLGFGGLSGVAVALDTFKETGYPSANFIGIATGASGGHLTFASTSSKIPALRKGTHKIGVSVTGGKLNVSVDGKQYLSTAVSLPPNVLAGFTGATGGLTDKHTVSNVSIGAGGHLLPPPGGGWSFNAAGGMAGSDVRLTPALTNQAGTVIYPRTVPARGLRMRFDAQLSGGTGADGMTFALLNPAKSTATSVGGSGGSLGFGGLQGVALTLDTHRIGTFPSSNFAGLTTGARTATGLLRFQARVRGIAPLRTGTHIVTVRVTTNSAGTDVLIVSLDGAQIFQQPEPLLNQWKSVRLAFTGGTGGSTDVHTARDVTVSVPN